MRLLDMRSDKALRRLGRRRLCRLQKQKGAGAVTTNHTGRRPRRESRAEEFRQRLIAWKRTPKPSRLSLRAVASELGTSHQLLSHYLKAWDKWEWRDYRRRAAEIHDGAHSENRSLSAYEASQAGAYQREATQSLFRSVVQTGLQQMLVRQKAGSRLSKAENRFVNVAARKGFATANEILKRNAETIGKSKNNLPAVRFVTANSFRSEFGKVATPLKRTRTLSCEKTAISVKIVRPGSES